jgi:hypothetical protein
MLTISHRSVVAHSAQTTKTVPHLPHGVSQAVEVLAVWPRRAMRMHDLLCNLVEWRRTQPVDVLRPACALFMT